MTSSVLTALLILPLALGWDSLGEREKVQTVCVGKEFRLPVDSTSRIVTFSSHPDGDKRVLLDKTSVKDPRWEWTRDKSLVLKEASQSDQGLYANKLSLGFTYETVHLIVSECIKPYRRLYGETFEHSVPENGSLLEFSPRGSPPDALPVVLWNRSDPDSADSGRGRLLRGGGLWNRSDPDSADSGRGRLLRGAGLWVADRVTQDDQGNYTMRDRDGKVVSRSTLSVRGYSFNISRFIRESVTLPLFLPVPHSHLIFTPSPHADEFTLGPFDPKPPRGPVQLMREGQITDQDVRYRGIVSLSRNGSIYEVLITRLTSRHDGLYQVRDGNGNLVSSTFLQVIDKKGTWRALLKSITVPSGMFVSLAGFILFMKRYPSCSLSQIITSLRTNRSPPENPPTVNIQDYNQPCPQSSDYYSPSVASGTPRKWTPHASPAHTNLAPGVFETLRSDHEEVQTLTAENSSPSHNIPSEQVKSTEEENRVLFSVAGTSDCLHSSDECVRFQMKKEEGKRWSRAQDFFTRLPLDTETPETSDVYTSKKLNFL